MPTRGTRAGAGCCARTGAAQRTRPPRKASTSVRLLIRSPRRRGRAELRAHSDRAPLRSDRYVASRVSRGSGKLPLTSHSPLQAGAHVSQPPAPEGGQNRGLAMLRRDRSEGEPDHEPGGGGGIAEAPAANAGERGAVAIPRGAK